MTDTLVNFFVVGKQAFFEFEDDDEEKIHAGFLYGIFFLYTIFFDKFSVDQLF